MRAQRPQFGGQRGEPREAARGVRGGRAEVVQGLHQAALLGGQVGDGLGQGIIMLNASPWLAGCCRAGHPGGAVLAGQVTGPPAERYQVTWPDPPPWAGEQPGQ